MDAVKQIVICCCRFVRLLLQECIGGEFPALFRLPRLQVCSLQPLEKCKGGPKERDNV